MSLTDWMRVAGLVEGTGWGIVLSHISSTVVWYGVGLMVVGFVGAMLVRAASPPGGREPTP